ncbi:hypothetical protein JVT61DRAFT_12168 [Boletus reticuloceps]|uniref:Fungal-type protein kinase domain-containing protein n=1 Tax=Boletus reticuloceps TaxID=495285 RepID=A0A8I2YEE4_9AGAM|nr:hypothetical protein JVT61DRAFT_12168 [Boletus reticuloceps]
MHGWNITIPFEFKRKNKRDAKNDNEAKIIWSLNNMMCEDPCRHFTLGITIEDKDMRIWCHNCAYLVALKLLDFTMKINVVIALFYLIACQDEVGLRWDPTVKCVYDGDKVQYKCTISSEVFTTIGELAMYGADAVLGHGTRVYKAKGKDGTAKFGQQDARKYFVQVCISKDVEIFGKLDTALVFVGLDKLEWIDVDVEPVLSTMLQI